ncbi:MAG: DUF2064 domain-containing protein [Gammaproteobacteria bacterium]|nr:DUF2064 domain-containing protein [Gammaproteobacteria bacterium]MBT3860370.1 DUF2064 domain-containing protein [Gammaproteobacteria bacterium]MBT3985985.1 DUF2064 domain-containing protein [Gammaproteobacteria bacterium]MBT4582347.1 DUF2064 domain-containing protein [Gammaproteobacteria bacterium]MBT4658909.1 DUF2064 domain-containing protein [Gammaproteobacteria bacterium]
MKEQKKQEVAVEKISFILPVLNEKRLVGPQLERLQVYRSAGHEVLLIDGGSSDGSPSGLAGLVDYVDIAPPGRSSQMNRGAELASGDILLFLHIDTILPESADTLIRDACKQAEWGWFDVELADDGWPYRLISWMMNRRSRITAVCTGDQALFVKRGLFLDVGGFPALPLMEDVAISKLLRGRSAAMAISSPVRTSARRWRENGLISTVMQMWLLRLRYFLGSSPESLSAMYYPPKRCKFPQSRIAIFAREPVLGAVKTRLAADIGDDTALGLYKRMATRIVTCCRSSALAKVELWVSSNVDNKYFLSVCNKRDIYSQCDGGLGAKMSFTVAEVLERNGAENLILIGTDCPAMDYKYLEDALFQLNQAKDGVARVVLGPAEDGGYVLIGLNRSIPGIFQNISWGSSGVLEETLAYIRSEGIDYCLLPPLRDIDTLEDLDSLASLDPPIQY